MGTHVIVCIKAVAASASKGGLSRSLENCDLNPFDRAALELALQIRQERGGSVSVVSMGPESCKFLLHEVLALGVDRAVLVSDPALAGSDTLVTSTVLATAIKKLSPFDLLLFGIKSSDGGTGHVGPQICTLLTLPLVSSVHTVRENGDFLTVERFADGFHERYRIPFPCCLTVHPSSFPPRDVGLSELGSAFEKGHVEVWDLTDLGIPSNQVGESGSPTRVVSLSRRKKAKSCEFLTGSPRRQVEEIVRRLIESGRIS